VLSIYYYGEHWNARKVIAIALSIGAVVLLR
jgi:multidrug transporter EmrE-like cation transporter